MLFPNKPGNQVMIDLETLGTKPNSVMLTIGALRFNPWGDDSEKQLTEMDTFYRRVEVESYEGLDHNIDDATLEWWGNQNEKVRAEAFAEDDRHPLPNVLADLYKRKRGLVDA